MKQDRNMLQDHGTKLVNLKPSSILATAEADLYRRARNAERGEDLSGTYEHYAFHRKHVKKAADAKQLMQLAMAEPGLGAASGKYNTRLIYSDVDLLREAIKLVTHEMSSLQPTSI